MKIKTIVLTASNYEAENKLDIKFLSYLQSVIDEGGSIINIVKDGRRYKKAYVTVPTPININ